MGRKKKPVGQRHTKVLSARVKLDLYKNVEAVAKQSENNLTQVIRLALHEYVANRKHPASAVRMQQSFMNIGESRRNKVARLATELRAVANTIRQLA
jgi:hypothetical protein